MIDINWVQSCSKGDLLGSAIYHLICIFQELASTMLEDLKRLNELIGYYIIDGNGPEVCFFIEKIAPMVMQHLINPLITMGVDIHLASCDIICLALGFDIFYRMR